MRRASVERSANIRRFRARCLALAMVVAGMSSPVVAEIATTGDIDPSTDPMTWTSLTTARIGCTADGTLSVASSSVLASGTSYIGCNSNLTGVVTIEGSGSSWTNYGDLSVGYGGNGTLNINGGAAVTNASAWIGCNPGSRGAANVAGSGTTWTNSTLVVGYNGSGTLTIRNGATVTVTGESTCNSGKITISGRNATWNSGDLSTYGATLNILDGAAVNSGTAMIAGGVSSKALVTVNGPGSRWSCSGDVTTFTTLNIVGGGVVAGSGMWVNNSLLAVDVSSVLTSAGTLTNNDTVRLMAGTNAAAGIYTPISAGAWNGTGNYEAVGGKWDESCHQFTVSNAKTDVAGLHTVIDPATVQRMLITDSTTHRSVGVSFLAAAATGEEIDLMAATVSNGGLTSLRSLLSPGQTVLAAWDISVSGTGYATNDPAYLSLAVGLGWYRNDLRVWHYDGTSWSPFDALDLCYDGNFASFTVTGFGGYAVAVPEPGILALSLTTGFALAVYCICKRRLAKVAR